jgi:hypothetical protein
MQPPHRAPEDARCALHPDQVAIHVCARCGSFMCGACSQGGVGSNCPSCRRLSDSSPFPFVRNDFSFNQIFSFAIETFKRDWLMLCLAVLIVLAVSGMASGISSLLNQVILAVLGLSEDSRRPFSNIPVLMVSMSIGIVVSTLISAVVQGFMTLGLYRVVIDVLDGKKADLGRLFSQGRKVGRYFVLYLIIMALTLLPMVVVSGLMAAGVLVTSGVSMSDLDSNTFNELLGPGTLAVLFLGLLALIVYLFWLMPLWLFGVPELVVSEASATEALGRAWRMADQMRMNAILYSMASGLVILAGVVACCVGIIPAMAVYYLMTVGLFLAVRNGPELGLPERE